MKTLVIIDMKDQKLACVWAADILYLFSTVLSNAFELVDNI